MTTTDVFEATLFVALFVFAILVLFSLVGMRWRKYRGQGWREYGPRLLRYVGIRLSIAIAVAGAFCVILAAALTLITGYDYLQTGLRHMAEDAPSSGSQK